MKLPKPGKQARDYGRRGAMASISRYRIEGEYVTLTEIAARIGRSAKHVSYRMNELRGATGPVTWERLRA